MSGLKVMTSDQDLGKQEAYQQDIFLLLPCMQHGFQTGRSWGAGWGVQISHRGSRGAVSPAWL